MKQLETLLNSLIQMGWKSRGINRFTEVLVSGTVVTFYTKKGAISHTSLRDIVSLESGLWQFVCDKELYSHQYRGEFKFTLDGVIFDYYQSSYKFRLLESALIPEEKLAQFLVDNIVIEGNSK